MDAFGEALKQFLYNLTGSSALTVLIVSMFPLVELKGAIPVGEALGLELFQSARLAFLGSTIICVPVFFGLLPIFNLLKRWKPLGRIIERVEGVFISKADGVARRFKGKGGNERRVLALGVYAFVAIPLPLTGVWTGTAISVFLGLKFKECILPLVLGNLTAGGIITLITWLFKDYVEYIITGMLIIAIVMLIIFVIRIARERRAA